MAPMTKSKYGYKRGQAKEAVELRRRVFIEAYLSNGENISQAALAAGFSPKSAPSQGSRLLKNAKTQQELKVRRAQLLAVYQLTTERTLREIARIAYADPRKFYRLDGTLKPITELDDDAAAAVASLESDEITAGESVIGATRKLKFWDKNQALEKAMKHLGAYELDNKQANAELADAAREANTIAKSGLRGKFDQVLGRGKK